MVKGFILKIPQLRCPVRSLVKKITLFALAVSVLGCAAPSAEIKEKSESLRLDVFTEVAGTDGPREGFTTLEIRVSLKKHMGEEPEQPFLINIDGQAVAWMAKGVVEALPVSQGPEGGKGMKYQIDKTLRLSPGRHRVTLGLPEDGYARGFDINLKQDRSYVLELVPVYNYSPSRDVSNFNYGLARYNALLNIKK